MLGVIFDLDDTLIASSPVYYSAILDVMKMIEKDIYPDFYYIGDLLELYHEVEATTVHEDLAQEVTLLGGFSSTVGSPMPLRLATFYYEGCMRKLKIPTKHGVQQAYNIGMRVFQPEMYRLVPGAKSLIHLLGTYGDQVTPFIVTHGDPRLQSPKLGMKSFNVFEEVIIVPMTETKLSRFKDLRERYDNIEEWYVVGDSVTADINPALALGFKACHIKRFGSHISGGDLVAVGLDAEARYKAYFDINQFTDYLRGELRDRRNTTAV